MGEFRETFEHELFHQKNPQLLHLLLNRFFNKKSEFICVTAFDNGEIIYANKSFSERLGYESDELKGLTAFDLHAWDGAAQRDAFKAKLAAQGCVEDLVLNPRDKYGRTLTFILSVETVTIDGVQCNLSVGRDITKVTAIENYRYESVQEELLQTIRSMDALVIKMKRRADNEFYYVLAEGRIAEEFGYTTANSYGRTVRELFPGRMEKEGDLYERVWRGETVSLEFELMGRMLYKTLSPSREHGAITGIFGSAVDITERKNMEKMLRVSELNAALGQLAAGAAHEIRNPLTAVSGFVQLLGEQLKAQGLGGQSYIPLILSELARINDLVSEMLRLRKPKESSVARLNASALLQELLPLIYVDANMQNTQLDLSGLTGEDADILANGAQLKQVVLNLCKNGLEAMGSGGTLALAVRRDGRKAAIVVKDSGPGIPPDVLEKLFMPFFTTKPSGNGLGLFISRQIVLEMGGELTLHADSTGTEAVIAFPAEPDRIEASER
ncbi:PAS fold-containing protein [Paenibacillus sp. UNC496MF]|uniref:PAS domain-containing sensor histidine kinase n=1 Tax=Paenibacillus sp. UNC496MF TaxID=1502753 RepID=UPI0008E1A962|nr:PAS domain-containing sensor histidine kinase [Paenibacillus sp. UNC496MF]SFI50616.1 PAS fold-containing protein [Paenibacillus sp. UNC496MF]